MQRAGVPLLLAALAGYWVLTACSVTREIGQNVQPGSTGATDDTLVEKARPGLHQRAVGGGRRPAAQPHLIVYKPKGDLWRYVPITLDELQERVVSYPGREDVYYNGKLAYPIPIGGGYYIDVRGISSQSVVTKFSYDEYASLRDITPTLLMESIKDFSPFERIYDCGVQESDIKSQAEKHLRENFKSCRSLPLPSPPTVIKQ